MELLLALTYNAYYVVFLSPPPALAITTFVSRSKELNTQKKEKAQRCTSVFILQEEKS